MPFSLLRLGAIAALFAGACSGSTSNSDNSPGNLSITPNGGDSSAPVATVIAGTGFLAKATVPQGGGETTLDTRHRAWIGDYELTKVTWQSTTKLDATVPADVPSGTYDLVVENAIGNRGTLKAAYTARDINSPAALTATLTSSSPTPAAGQPVTMTLQLANAAGGRATDVTAVTPSMIPTDGISCTAAAASAGAVPSAAAPIRIAGGTTETFTWTCTSAAGSYTLSASVTATDVNAGASIATNVTGVVVTYGGTGVPAAPGITGAAPGDRQVTLTWTEPASNGAPISGYVITADRGVGARTTPSAATTYSFDGLTNGMAYTFTVAAINSAGTGPASAPSAAVTPVASPVGADMSAAVSMSDLGAPVGEYVTGTATCTNGGPNIATNPTCSVTGLPVGATLGCTPALPATLESGAAVTCSMQYAMPAAAVTVTVTAGSATEDRTPANNSASWTTNLTPTFLQPGVP
ncbi:MAG: hypothetical protein A2V77_24555 [Anaeromyxobacter sp. RBG_16_69_14]|nr:MAG: hypothetical protein A2V77_24555 [Anaeromyxobacter sp. RBG_16_69_14]